MNQGINEQPERGDYMHELLFQEIYQWQRISIATDFVFNKSFAREKFAIRWEEIKDTVSLSS